MVRCGRSCRVLALVMFFAAVTPWSSSAESRRGAESFDSRVASTWFDRLYDVIMAEKIAPPVAARIYGTAAVALYESIVPGTASARSLARQLNGLTSVPQPYRGRNLHWPTVANAALASTIRGLLPQMSASSLAAVEALEQQFASEFQVQTRPSIHARSVLQGQTVANAVVAWISTDGLANLNNCPYTPPVGPGLWSSTPPSFAPPLQPCWGQLRPFVLTSGAECGPPPPPAFSTDSSSELFALALQVYDTKLNLTPEQETVALFWADNAGASGTPPGHWIAIMAALARDLGLSLADAAEGFARVGIAVADAFISCWNAKYTYNVLRPVSYINDVIDETWSPLLATPPFPSYTSGHSSQSAAAATLLTDMFGALAFVDSTRTTHALQPALAPRSFQSFEQAAEEAALSRLYAGIHFATDNNVGMEQGHCIGRAIIDRVQFKKRRLHGRFERSGS